MPTKKNPDLHGNVPEHSETALLLIDVINDLEFDDGKKLVKPAMARSLRNSQLARGVSWLPRSADAYKVPLS